MKALAAEYATIKALIKVGCARPERDVYYPSALREDAQLQSWPVGFGVACIPPRTPASPNRAPSNAGAGGGGAEPGGGAGGARGRRSQEARETPNPQTRPCFPRFHRLCVLLEQTLPTVPQCAVLLAVLNDRRTPQQVIRPVFTAPLAAATAPTPSARLPPPPPSWPWLPPRPTSPLLHLLPPRCP